MLDPSESQRPPGSAPALEPQALDALKFRRRRESWVAESSGCFYKIIRKGNDPWRDLVDPACIDTAQREYTDMRFLHAIDKGACRPDRVQQGCVVYPRLSGPDMRAILMSNAPRAQKQRGLREAMRLLARLHAAAVEPLHHPAKDYERESFLPPGEDLMQRMAGRQRTLVVTGFEARNFRFDKASDAWFFFDPHHVWSGHPEEDFARFVVSLLMIRGKRGGLRAWTGFDRRELLSTYENFASAQLDRTLLNYFLGEQLAKRRFYAIKWAQRLPLPSRIPALAYTRLYYNQLLRACASQEF